ncbi:hypothetical protein EMIHUDRAFT_201067 [Emiliania huxleyi CCMP1516]|uniref:glutathione gamma-glutamylcysteinyltransferase n=2 Tax=Emiliania huxleyi TaxID=2903 RepID=A0A0D3KM34_EMIH1|nr:hypothetical protein EMIHUDRAFT_201067 [Emiliania huxleyi CCMP1516]EOD36819.1 hypothetical protein EMIHUDRAFT_201067 [Emiliania huxleyi CCMP1516]|eukprot:XP_005789248.1 hypothetical protein EMIHUDRAFT_201067 [Emiliania huxleyi CCMP1516]
MSLRATWYEIRDGRRHVVPYTHEFVSNTKGRWVGRKEAVAAGRLTLNGGPCGAETVFRHGDRLVHEVVRTEPSVPAAPIGLLLEADDLLVSGVLLLPRTAAAASRLGAALEGGGMRKQYLARVAGSVPIRVASAHGGTTCGLHASGKPAETVLVGVEYDAASHTSLAEGEDAMWLHAWSYSCASEGRPFSVTAPPPAWAAPFGALPPPAALSEAAVLLSSEEGRRLLLECAPADRAAFDLLWPHFRCQAGPTMCGAASVAMLLRAAASHAAHSSLRAAAAAVQAAAASGEGGEGECGEGGVVWYWYWVLLKIISLFLCARVADAVTIDKSAIYPHTNK